ncbi:MAG: SLC13 family permease [bacterium]
MNLPYLILLAMIFFLVLFLPFLNKRVEKNLEAFFLIMGSFSIFNLLIFGKESLNIQFAIHCLKEPIIISLACLISGLLFHHFQNRIKNGVFALERSIGLFFPFLLIVFLGIISSIITAIITSLILVEIIYDLSIKRKEKIAFCVLSCFSIGLGAALTPIGEPLSTIAISKLKGPPHNAGFFFLFNILYPYILSGIILLAIVGAFVYKRGKTELEIEKKEEEKKEIKRVFIRSAKVYIFIIGLVLLGEGFKPFVNLYVSNLSPFILYLLNISSSILDNATLAACEIGPHMSLFQIKASLLSLLISGGMLIPGNIPNIICAERLEIGIKEWAKIGIPICLIFLIIFFIFLS